MDAEEILITLVQRYPGLLPWKDHHVDDKEHQHLVCELTILVGSWDRVDNFIPPGCGHAKCCQNWIDTGERKCLAPGCSPNPDTACDSCGGAVS